MFGNRKRKPQEEDDSLVPHGLIWYATEPAPPEEKAPPDNPARANEVVHDAVVQIVKPQLDPSPKFVAESSSAHLEQPPSTCANPPQAPAEIRKHISAFPPLTLVQQRHTPAPDTTQFTAQSALKHIHVAEVIEIEPASSDEPTFVARGAAWLRSSTTAGWNWANSRGESFGRNLERFWTSFEFRRRVHQGRQLTGELLRNGIGFSRRYSETTERAVLFAARNGLKQQRRLLDRVKLGLAAATERTLSYARTNSFPSRRITVVLTGLPLRMRISVARRISEWKMTGTGGDGRLRTSMTLAAISATIVLIIISLVPHFASRSLPSRIFSHPSTVSASTETPVASTEPVVATAPSNKPVLKVAELTTNKPTQKQKVPAPSAQLSKRKVYRTAEDDYIAPDTYVYYGNKAVPR